MLELLPPSLPPPQRLPEIVPAQGKRRGRVALLVGCVQQVLDPDINAATVDVLSRNGVEVVIPPSQGCCGALSWHTGSLEEARRFARQNVAAFPEDVDAIISNAAGCGSGMQEYPLILKGEAEGAAAVSFAHRVMDISAYLEKLGELEPIADPGRPLRIAYHDACHLANGQGVRSEPRELLKRIPGVEILEVADGHLCCGSAGSYNIDQPEIASELGSRKTDNILALKPDLAATGNIGCLSQLRVHLGKKDASALPLRHTIQILRDAYEQRL